MQEAKTRLDAHPGLIISFIYFCFGVSWILLSDQVALALFSMEQYPLAQTFKGVLYILLTTGLLFGLASYFFSRLRKQADYYRTLFEHNPLPMWICDPETLKVMDSNLTASRKFGHSRNAFKTMHLGELSEDTSSPKLLTILNGIQGEPLVKLRHQKGSVMDMLLGYQLINEGLLVSAQDVTEQKRAEAVQQGLNQQLKSQNEDLGYLTQILSHHFRLGTANILGLLELLQIENRKDLKDKAIMTRLNETAHQQDLLLKELHLLLNLYHQENVEPERVELSKAIEQAMNSLESELPDPAWCPEMQLTQEPLHTVSSYLVHILIALLRTAIQHRSPHRPLWVKITSETKENGLQIVMMDNSENKKQSIPRDKQSKMCLSPTQFQIQDNGLGLYLACKLAERLKGQLEIETQPDKGSCFRLMVPNMQSSFT